MTRAAISPAGSSLFDAERHCRSVRPDFGSKFGQLDTREQVTACVDLVKRAGLDFLVLDQTRPDIEVPVVRVIVPGLRHFYRRFGPGRLYDVPMKLGWRDRPLPETRAQSASPPDLRGIRCALPEKNEGAGLRRRRGCPPGSAVTSRSKRARTENRRLLRRPFGRLGNVQRGRGGARAGPAHGSAARARLRPTADSIDKEIHLLVRRLAGHGLLEYRLGRSRDGEDHVVIEPQVPGLLAANAAARQCRRSRPVAVRLSCAGAATRWSWNRRAPARCSRFAIRRLRPPSPCCRRRNRSNSSVGRTIFRESSFSLCWWIAGILFKVDAAAQQRAPAGRGRRRPRALGLSRSPVPRAQHGRPARQPAGRSLSICRRHGSAAGGAAELAGRENRSAQALGRAFGCNLAGCKLLRERHSTRVFDDQRPITLVELSRFLDGTARVQSQGKSSSTSARTVRLVEYASRPYPSGGGSWELELYLAVDKCEGLARGFYHYDAGAHALVPIGVAHA